MACINMFNPDHPHPHPMSPRISFSNDFAVDPPPPRPSSTLATAASDASFEFSPVGTRPMMAADELFFKGRMLPLRGGGGGGSAASSTHRVTTLRDELLCSHDTDVRPPKGSSSSSSSSSSRWKELLGLKKPHCTSGTAKKISAEAAPEHKDVNGDN